MPMTFGMHEKYSDDYEGCQVFIDGHAVGRLTDNGTGMWELTTLINGKRSRYVVRHPMSEREAKIYFGTLYSQGRLTL